MLPSGVKICVTLLWGLCVLFSVESLTTSKPVTNAEDAVTLSTTSMPVYVTSTNLNPEHKPAEVSSTKVSQTAVFSTTATGKSENNAISISNGSDGSATIRTPDATTMSKGQRSTAESTAENGGRVSSVDTTAASGAGHSSLVTVSVSKVQHSPAVTINSGTAQPPQNTTIEVVPNPSHQPSTRSTLPTATSLFAATSSDPKQHTLSTDPQRSSKPASTSSLETSTQTGWNSTQNLRSSPSSTITNSGKPTSEDTSKSGSTSTDSPSSTSAFSNGTTGVLFPVGPGRLPVPSTTSPRTKTTPNENSKTSPTNETCSNRSIIKQCLIIIAVLAAVATIFIVSTIVLCTKLAAKKYKLKRSQLGTEMICISSLLPERNYTYTRQRNHIANGVQVLPTARDSDEDGEDNVTLSSFLPENERYV